MFIARDSSKIKEFVVNAEEMQNIKITITLFTQRL